jgi:hypothetical protein
MNIQRSARPDANHVCVPFHRDKQESQAYHRPEAPFRVKDRWAATKRLRKDRILAGKPATDLHCQGRQPHPHLIYLSIRSYSLDDRRDGFSPSKHHTIIKQRQFSSSPKLLLPDSHTVSFFAPEISY